jgi:predicted phage-related endonuclease
MTSDGLVRESWEITSRGEWLDRRRNHVTASRVAAIFGEHPFLSRDELAAELRGERNGGDNPAMRAGRILEPAVIAAIIEEHPEWAPSIVKATTYHWLPEFRLGATPDYFWGDDGLIQVKTVSPQEWERWRGTAPLAYVLQTLTELLVTGRTRGILAIMVRSPSYPLHLREVPRHAAAEQRILDAVVAWWREHDAGRIAPAVSSAEIAAETDDGSYIDLSGSNDLPGLLEERAQLKAGTSEAEKRLKAIDATIRERVGAARSAWLPGWLIRLPSITARAYTVPERVYRRLDVRPTKEEDAA